MAAKGIGWKELDLETENRLDRVYHAGLKPKEFTRVTRIEEVETICISLLCDEVMRYVAEANNTKQKKSRLIAFSDLSYIWSGIIIVFDAQVKVLYDEAMRQAHYTLEYVRKTETVITLWQQPTKSSISTKNRSRKNNEPMKHLPKKRVRFAAEFDCQSLNDSEVDDESTIQILQTSKVMNRDQISIREVISESLPDILSENSDFEEAGGSTQNFLAITELVAKGRSIAHAIASVSHMGTGENEPYDEDGYYGPMISPHLSPPPHSPLPDIGSCYEESDVEIAHRDDSDEINAGRPGSASSHKISLPSLPSKLLLHTPAKKVTKRRRVFDVTLQILAGVDDPEKDKKLMRCTDGRLDCVTKVHIMRELKMVNFYKPAHAFRGLKSRGETDIAPMMVGLNRVKKTKRKEPNDLNMVQDFLKSFGCEPNDLQLEDLRNEDQSRQNRVNRKRSSSNYDVADSPPQPCNERLSQTSEMCDLDSVYQEDEPMDDPDEAVPVFIEPEPIADPPDHSHESVPEHEPNLPIVNRSPIMNSQGQSDMVVPECEPNLPIVNRSPIMDRVESVMVKNVSETSNFRLENENMPRSVLRLLNQFVTVTSTDERCKSPSQILSLLNNKKNRESWGMKGVLQNLFRLWYKNVHPIGMVELLHPQRQKLAAALAFYSIMELNSPRVGLIEIQKAEDSNAVYNITMSEKLLNLLRKSNGRRNECV